MITLSNALRANAFSCLTFGCVFLVCAEVVVRFLSESSMAPEWIVLAIGGVLVANGIHLLWASFQKRVSRALIVYFCLGDFAWVFLSVGLILIGFWVTSAVAIITTLLIAVWVGVLAALQWKFLSKGL